MTHKDFVTYEQAVKLKELGFDWRCSYYYQPEKGIPEPTLAYAQKWLREVKGVKIFITYGDVNEDCYGWEIIHNGQHYTDLYHGNFIETYEEALLESIEEALELLKQQNNGK